MLWSTRTQQGLALAAIVLGDRAAAACEPGLAPDAASEALAEARRLATLDSETRRAAVASLTAELRRPIPEDVVLPPAARVLLAPLVSKATGRAWIAAAPPRRPGYVPEPGLRHLIRDMARDGANPKQRAEQEAAQRRAAELRWARAHAVASRRQGGS